MKPTTYLTCCRTVVFLTTVVLFAGCATSTTSSPATAAPENVLRVGVTPDAPPIVYKQGREIVGLEADLAGMLAGELGKTVRFVSVPWEQQIPALLEGRTDIIMSGMSITRPRGARVAFANPYLRAGQIALIRGADNFKYRMPKSPFYKEARIGVQGGTTGDSTVQQVYPRSERVVFSDPAKAARAVQRNNIDVFIHDAPIIWWLAAQYEAEGLVAVKKPLTDEYFAWAVRPGDQALLEHVNGFVAKHQADGSLNQTIKRWLPYAVP